MANRCDQWKKVGLFFSSFLAEPSVGAFLKKVDRMSARQKFVFSSFLSRNKKKAPRSSGRFQRIKIEA
jgi:hypothetical protein